MHLNSFTVDRLVKVLPMQRELAWLSRRQLPRQYILNCFFKVLELFEMIGDSTVENRFYEFSLNYINFPMKQNRAYGFTDGWERRSSNWRYSVGGIHPDLLNWAFNALNCRRGIVAGHFHCCIGGGARCGVAES